SEPLRRVLPLPPATGKPIRRQAGSIYRKTKDTLSIQQVRNFKRVHVGVRSHSEILAEKIIHAHAHSPGVIPAVLVFSSIKTEGIKGRLMSRIEIQVQMG